MVRRFGWSKNVLAHQIDNQSYEKSLLGQTNFDKTLTTDAVKAQMTSHLSKPMGAVIGDIEKRAPLPSEIWEKVKSFQAERNWLVHDFDEEAISHLVAGEKIPDYTARMESIAQAAVELMELLDGVGKDMAGAWQPAHNTLRQK